MSGLSALDAASLEIQVIISLLFIRVPPLAVSLHRLRLTCHCFSAQEFKPDSSAIGEDEETKYQQHDVGVRDGCAVLVGLAAAVGSRLVALLHGALAAVKEPGRVLRVRCWRMQRSMASS